MMSAVLYPRGVRCKLVHIFHTEVKGEHHDGRSEAWEGILPQVVEERVSSPRVLSSEYHGAEYILSHNIPIPIQSERRKAITQNDLKRSSWKEKEQMRLVGEKTTPRIFIVAGTSYKNDQLP